MDLIYCIIYWELRCILFVVILQKGHVYLRGSFHLDQLFFFPIKSWKCHFFFFTINPMLSEIANNPRISNINNANSKTSERKTIAMWPKWKEESQYTSTEYPPRSPCEVPAALPSAGTVWFLVKTVYRVLVAPMALLSLWRCFASRERRWQRGEKPDTLSLGRLVTDCRRVFSCYWLDRTEMCLVHALISMVGHLK